MKKYLLAAVFVVAFAAPAFAANYCVALKAWRCRRLMRGHDDSAGCETHKMMGKYKSEAEAKAAMATMKECGG